PGIKYFDGSSRSAGEGTRNFVVFDENDLTILKRNDELLRQDVEKDLINVHNLSEEGLLAAAELGGLAAPSVATIRAGVSDFEGFGEISLLATPDFLTDFSARTFDADIYSPRQSRAVHDINIDKARELYERLDPEGLGLSKPDHQTMEESDGAMHLRNSPAFEYEWMKAQGKAPRLKKRKVDPVVRKFAKTELDRWELADDLKFIKAVTKHYQAQLDDLTAEGFDVRAEKMTDWFFKDGIIRQNKLREWAGRVADYRSQGGVDTFQLQQDIAKKMRVKKTRDAYEAHVADTFNDLVKSKKLFKGFTAAGNRKYVPYNMDNVIKDMTKQLQAGENFFYGAGTVRSAYAKELTTLKQIQAKRDKIVSEKDFKQVKEQSSEVFTDALDALRPYYKYDSTSFGYLDDAGTAITEGRRALNDAFNMDADAYKIVDDLIEYLVALPTSYFETKFRRPVQFGEFSTAVVPKGLKKEALQVLKDAGLRVKYYDSKKKESRGEVIAQQRDLLYQKDAAQPEARGYYDPANSVIRLTESANLSTFLHEFAHFMYEMEKKSAGDTGLLDGINSWYKRNAKEVAAEANTYLGEKFDELKQSEPSLPNDMPRDRIDVYRYLVGFDGRTKADLIDIAAKVASSTDTLQTFGGSLLGEELLEQVPDAVLAHASDPSDARVYTVWTDSGDAYRVIKGKASLISKEEVQASDLNENDGITLNILSRVFREIKERDPAEQERLRVQSLRGEETRRRQGRMRDVPKVSPDFDIALQELADWSENFEEFKNALTPDLMDLSDRNRTRLGRAAMALTPDDYENAGSGRVTIHRAMPTGEEIEAGDWVSMDQSYAAGHESNVDGDASTVSIEVDGTEVWWEGTDPHEWVYIPSDTWNVESLEELWDGLTEGSKPLTYPEIEGGPIYAQSDTPTPTPGKITAENVIEYLDIGSTGDVAQDAAVRRAVHEQFARGFETYLMEGKAPSIELRNAFRTFARWLAQVYQAFRNKLQVNLDNEMRQVFDRLLATEEQIHAAEARARVEPFFTDATTAGMTEKQFADYKQRQSKVKDAQSETLRDKIIAQLTRQTKAWWREEKQDIVNEELDRLKTEKVYAASSRLRDGDIKLDHASTKDLVGEEKVDKLGRKSVRVPSELRGMTAKGQAGVHPDEAAAFFGYRSGDEMLTDIVTAPAMKTVAESNAEKQMIERHGDILTDGTIEQQADDAVRSEERGRLILHELKMIARGTNQKAIDRDTMKAISKEKIGSLSFREIHPGKYRKAEIAAAQEAARMLAEGNREGAAHAKQRQAVNYFMGLEATEAKNAIVKIVDHKARYNKKKVREEIQKAEGGYWEQIVKILERFEFRKSATLKKVDQVNQDINTWARDRMELDGDGLVLHNAVLNESYITHWKNVAYSDIQGVHDSVKNIEHVARYANKITRMGEEIEYNKLVERWTSSITEKVGPRFKSKRTDAVEGRKWGRWLMAQMSKIPWMASWLDGGERVGVSHQVMVQPFTDAYVEEIELWKGTATPVMEAIENRSKADMKRHNRKVYIPEIEDHLYGHQILAVALNTGNQSNLKKMLLGEGWADPDNDVEIAFDNSK
ncbi:MAG: hypothetical protein GY937_19920, partial [bacterium]|nr:hypothetical protein [bacterium]